MSQQENRNESVNQREGSISQNTRINISDKSKALIVATLIALNLLATVWMFIQWKVAERESRLLEYYVMELDGKMMASGLLKPPDSWSGQHKGK
jgi:hypothetical protein